MFASYSCLVCLDIIFGLLYFFSFWFVFCNVVLYSFLLEFIYC